MSFTKILSTPGNAEARIFVSMAATGCGCHRKWIAPTLPTTSPFPFAGIRTPSSLQRPRKVNTREQTYRKKLKSSLIERGLMFPLLIAFAILERMPQNSPHGHSRSWQGVEGPFCLFRHERLLRRTDYCPRVL